MRRGAVIKLAAIGGSVVILALAVIGLVTWWKLFKTDEQTFETDLERFKYGSLNGEYIAGIPYPLFMILPRVFPDLVEKYATQGYGPEKFGHGGYGAFGLAWEEGKRLPAGLSVKRVGYERVTVNCSACHTTVYRRPEDEKPRFAFGGPGHTVNVQGLLRFLFAAAHDARFTAARLMPELALQFELDLIDYALYSLVLIPKTRLALKVGERQLRWMNQKTAWAPGRDDAFNLPKYVLTQSPWDDSVGNTDFPALWRLADRDGHLIHAGGEAKTVYAVVATSAFGAGSLPAGGFEERNRWIETFIRTLEPPAFPGRIDETTAARGKELFETHCAACHAKGGARTGAAIPLDEIKTDPEHVRTWTGRNADRMNLLTQTLGIRGAELQGAQGYVAKPLVGVWLLGPFLHNGSVPTLWDLLSPPEQRPAVFYRGYEVLDLERLGFTATGRDAQAKGFRFDTAEKGNGNGGHLYGTELSAPDKRALIEYAKTL
jgi:mono/diheme cytochrome c family protein